MAAHLRTEQAGGDATPVSAAIPRCPPRPRRCHRVRRLQRRRHRRRRHRGHHHVGRPDHGACVEHHRPAAALAVVVGEHGLLGWWEDGHWVQAEAGQSAPFTAGDEYTLIRLDEPSSTATATALGDPDEFCGTPQVDLEPPFPDPTGGAEHISPIAVHGVADPRPRPVTVLDPGAAVYRDAAADVLHDLGVDDARPRLAQVVRADLSGDGTDEVLVVAERLAQPDAVMGEPGDYSVLFLRQRRRRRGAHARSSRSTSRKPRARSPRPTSSSSRVAALADLNGDGTLEVVVQQRYYEGASTAVRTPKPDGSLEEVLGAGCGV